MSTALSASSSANLFELAGGPLLPAAAMCSEVTRAELVNLILVRYVANAEQEIARLRAEEDTLREALVDQFQQIYLTAYDRMTRAVRLIMENTGLLVAFRNLLPDIELTFPKYSHPNQFARVLGFLPNHSPTWDCSEGRRPDYGLHHLLTAIWRREMVPDTLTVMVYLTSDSPNEMAEETHVFRLTIATKPLLEGLFPATLYEQWEQYGDVSVRRSRLAETIEEKALPKLTRQALARLTEMSMAKSPNSLELPELSLRGAL